MPREKEKEKKSRKNGSKVLQLVIATGCFFLPKIPA